MTEQAAQNTLREQLTAQFDALEGGTPAELMPAPQTQEGAQPAEQPEGRARDESGRFARKDEAAASKAPAAETPQQPASEPSAPKRPTTWKKDYWGIYDKIAAGVALTPDESKKLAAYTVQREDEYKTGVSTYKTEAAQAKELQEAITPFLPELNANGIRPADWVKSLGQAHYALHKGTPELKLQVFRELARQFNVPIQLIAGQQQGQGNEVAQALMGQIHALQQQVAGVTTWRQQQETASITGQIEAMESDAAKYPHFTAVRETMAQLLEHGLAQDLHEAYEKSVWMVPEVRDQLTTPQPAPQVNKAQAAAQAKARAVSPKSATPSGAVPQAGTKDRRALLAAAFDEHEGGRV